jgi:molybdopterin-guanine dinucleotide biosynthesis protein
MTETKEHAQDRPFIIAVGGFTSNAGKTTLVCELLGALSGEWEAIKMTRGHYRSCGKDPHACCVSGLLGDEPLVRSGRDETYAPGKDTGRYWDAGAANVQWVIATNEQVEAGVRKALARVATAGVLIEGNSFLKFINADFVILAASLGGSEVKPTARRALTSADAVYLFSPNGDVPLEEGARQSCVEEWRRGLRLTGAEQETLAGIPVFTRTELSGLLELLRVKMAGPYVSSVTLV